jgi:hypothetical protein
MKFKISSSLKRWEGGEKGKYILQSEQRGKSVRERERERERMD